MIHLTKLNNNYTTCATRIQQCFYFISIHCVKYRMQIMQ